MRNQQHIKPYNISKLGVIILSIVLITGISFIPILQAGVYAQQQPQQSQQVPQQQQNRIGLSQVIKQIAQQVATANPGTNATQVYQILVQLAKLTAQTTSKEKAIEDIRQISSQVSTYPYGTVSQSLSHFAQQLVPAAAGSGRSSGSTTTNAVQIAQQITQDTASSTGKNVTQSVVDKAVQTATGASSNNINQHLRQIAQIISKQTGVPVQKIESIIIQIALQIAQAQGKAITGQYIFQIANQITNNSDGIFTQLLLQLVKQDKDDNGKSSHTVKIIKTVVRSGGGDGDSSGGHQTSKPDTTPEGYHWKKVEINTSSGKKITVDELSTPSGGKVIFYPDGTTKSVPPSNTNNKSLQEAFKKELQEAPTKYNELKTQNLQPPGTGGNPPLIQLDTGNRIKGPITVNLCFICASGNNIDNQREDKLATQTAQLTGVSVESVKLPLSDTYLRTLNKAGPAQASEALASFEAEAAADPTILNKVGDLAKLYDSGYDAVAYQASNSIADKLSAGANPKTALEETSVPKAVSLKADEVVKSVEDSQLAGAEQQLSSSSLSGQQLATKDTNLVESPEQDPSLFQLSTEQERSEQTNDGDDGLSASSRSVAGGTPEGGTTTEGGADEDEDEGDDDTSIAEFSGGGDDDSDGSTDDGGDDDSGDGGGGDGGDGGDEG
jgi:hypothetical protein